ncbi:hypothetical protein Asi02nite_32760 [Asanoa siamensis]|uniref:PPE family protein n=1 Tax=Asanoa siamensis TaxID=926357 RepID=A0ABQ4CR35_9ACTN|nr:hypothetical protein Asi02nite_32760 [Asanoa siamensis]
MRDAPTEGPPPTATDWARHDAPSMWRMLAPQETEAHWRHAAGLRKLTELTAIHMARLQVYRDQLAEAWPPEKSPAARTFIARLDYLIGHVRQTHEVAATNYTALTTATTTLDTARTQVAAIHNEYSEKLQARKTYDALIAQTKASQLPGTVIGPPPATDTDLERLNAKARSVMSSLSSTLVLAERQLSSPTPFGMQRREGGPTIQPPPAVPRVTSLEPARRPPNQTTFTQTPQLGTVPALAPDVADQNPQRPLAPKDLATRSVSAAASGRAAGERTTSTQPRGLQPVGPATAYRGTTIPHVAPTGGVIAPSGSKSPTAHRRPEVSSAVIAPRSETPYVAAPIGGPGRARDDGKSAIQQRLAEDQWEVRQGVPSVVLPPAVNVRIDPGPAIGLDR